MDKSDSSVVVLACGKGKCCPEVKFLDWGAQVRDFDRSNFAFVDLSEDQAKLLRDALCRRYGTPG